jgi:hypothetical protein
MLPFVCYINYCIDLDAFALKPPNITTPLDNFTRFGDRLPNL